MDETGLLLRRNGFVLTEKGGEGMTIQRMVELLEIEHECILRAGHDDCDRNCADCDLVQDDWELHEMYTDVIALLKEHEPQSVIFDRQCEVEPGRWERKGFCPKCHQVMLWMVNREYCGFCGQAVKWDV